MTPSSQLTSTKSPACGIRLPRNLPGLLGVVGRTSGQEWACNQVRPSSWFRQVTLGEASLVEKNTSSLFLMGCPWLFIWQVVSQVYVNNHYTGNNPSKRKPNPTHECEKCHVSTIMMSSPPFGKGRGTAPSSPMRRSVLILPSGRNKSREFSGPHPAAQALLVGSLTCSCFSRHGELAGLHVWVGQMCCYLQMWLY